MKQLLIIATAILALTSCKNVNDPAVGASPNGLWASAFCTQMVAATQTASSTGDEPTGVSVDMMGDALDAADATAGDPPERILPTIEVLRSALDSQDPTASFAVGVQDAAFDPLLSMCMAVTPQEISAAPRYIIDPLPDGYEICDAFDATGLSPGRNPTPAQVPFWTDLTLWADHPEDPFEGVVVQMNSPSGAAVRVDGATPPDVQVAPGPVPGTFDALVIFPQAIDEGIATGATPLGADEDALTDPTRNLVSAEIRLSFFGTDEDHATDIAQSLEYVGGRWQIRAGDLTPVVDLEELMMGTVRWYESISDGVSTLVVSPSGASLSDMELLEEFGARSAGVELASQLERSELGGHPALVSPADPGAFIEINGDPVNVFSVGAQRATVEALTSAIENLRPATAAEWNDILWTQAHCPQ